MLSQSLPNQVNDFNKGTGYGNPVPHGKVAIPSKPGQRLQCQKSPLRYWGGRLSQSLPNQVNDFNPDAGCKACRPPQCRNPFQTRSTTSINGGELRAPMSVKGSQSLPNQVNDFNTAGNWFYGRREQCRNPFQTRSTTSITSGVAPKTRGNHVSQSLPNQVNDFNMRNITTD